MQIEYSRDLSSPRRGRARESVPSRRVQIQVSAYPGRPPWGVATTAELAAAFDIPFGRLSNWIQRGQWPAAEPRHLYRLDGNKRVFRIDTVVEWLTGVTPTVQALSYLHSAGIGPQGEDVWDHVRLLERMGVFPHRWAPRDTDAYLAMLK